MDINAALSVLNLESNGAQTVLIHLARAAIQTAQLDAVWGGIAHKTYKIFHKRKVLPIGFARTKSHVEVKLK